MQRRPVRDTIMRRYDQELLGASLRGGTSMESSIPCSHGGRALVVKGAEEMENAETNSKHQDRTEGQRPWNFIRPVSTGFSSR
ncbi:hypothetical protein BHE74_00019131 [Ensete ventricosum]|nr:hypothetical protein GW17_00039510 [Ensete ventricosum]RWW73020.1 hypothetical protein BHE74_00019131 [Ensete ventricosum]RZS00778.1 hypothetical protein BHM03_00030547 [Ensete ventricosum]